MSRSFRYWVAGSLIAAVSLGCATASAEGPRVHQLPEEITFAGEAVPVDHYDTHSRISTWYNFYLSQPGRVSRWLERAEQVFPVVESVLADNGIPDDLKYVAVLESGLDPRALGGDGERGIWQFMSGTATDYGLSMGVGIDERGDIAASTEAAARYFLDAKARLGGTWNLAAASFNVGIPGVSARMARQNGSDYWEMVFPPVTEDYLSMAIAAKLIMENAASLGIEPQTVLPRLVEVTIETTDNPLYVTDISGLLEVSFRDLWLANPHIWKPYLPPGEYRIYLPEAAADGITARELEDFLRSQPYQRITHTADGEQTISDIAEELNISLDELVTFNNVAAEDAPEKDQEIVYWVRE